MGQNGVYVTTEKDPNGRPIPSYSNRSSPYSANLTSRYSSTSTQQPQTQQRPTALRSLTFNNARAGSTAPAPREAQYAARERQLLEGLPQRTSQWERERQIHNAGVGAPRNDGSHWDSKLTRAQRQAAMDATVGVQNKLRDQFAAEDAAYTNAYGNLTGRQDAAVMNDRNNQNARSLQGLRNQALLEQQGLQNQGYFDTAVENNRGSYERQDLAGRDRHNLAKLDDDYRNRSLTAEYGTDGTGGYRGAELDIRREAATRENQRADAELSDATKKRSMQELISLFNGNEGAASQIYRGLTPEQRLLSGPDLLEAVAPLAPTAVGGSYESGPRQWIPGVDDYAQPGSVGPNASIEPAPWYSALDMFHDSNVGDLIARGRNGEAVGLRRESFSPELYNRLRYPNRR